MHRHDVIQPITVALSEVLGRDLPDLREETRLFEDLNLDSTTILELLMALEDVLGTSSIPTRSATVIHHRRDAGRLRDQPPAGGRRLAR